MGREHVTPSLLLRKARNEMPRLQMYTVPQNTANTNFIQIIENGVQQGKIARCCNRHIKHIFKMFKMEASRQEVSWRDQC